ncbi:hypothetical protein CONLIGDRAFT_633442 [Coniochaeta ligniaria NRRL 30616]|uniref:Uncharacterized protein n=1 Tax=Coniochaeta ligniaria NRRL 30616 TaxID=1408157 RepID=A0A1J7IP75_9PEZI|nr:hypothetical protein CONLIGDRAFT_633442 [Coniochaeta ligniaria NRRL 30616]
MASAERDRVELNARIEQLELDKAALQESNIRTVEENRALLDRLELLNGTVTESEMKIRSLEAALQSTQLTIKRLESAAARAADLERHIATLEGDQERMQDELVHSEEEARSALYRWRKAERGIRDMQDQLERMEKEAKEERERHVEVIGRMERQRLMEKDLDTAAGRLKGAAAAKTLTDGSKNGSSVVSHFVRDLLQDNANLQLSMAELREMLINSNDEIQNLRQQLMYHQPLNGEGSATSTLRAELEPPVPIVTKRISQELHVHHHYHVTPKPELKKPKKKRHSLTPGVFTPPAVSSPSTPNNRRWQPNKSSPTPAILSHSTKGSVTSLPPPRWSFLSEQPSDFALSSVPSSPQSNHRNSMFDRGIVDMSFPASPTTSLDPSSPSWHHARRRRSSEASIRPIPQKFDSDTNISENDNPTSQSLSSLQNLPLKESPESTPTPPTAVTSSMDDAPDLTLIATSIEESVLQTSGNDADVDDDTAISLMSPDLDHFDPKTPQLPRSLRRVVSHESIMSMSNGMDIHTLKVRPSQLTLRPLGAAVAGTGISTVTASPTISRGEGGKRGSVILRDNLGLAGLGLSMPSGRDTARVVSGPMTRNSVKEPSQSSRSPLGRLVSWRLWGSPDPSAEVIRSPEPASPLPASKSPSGSGPPSISDARSTTSDSTGASSKPALELKTVARPPGINQAGAIPGFYEYWAAHQRRGAPSKVCPDVVDQEALREGLEGG